MVKVPRGFGKAVAELTKRAQKLAQIEAIGHLQMPLPINATPFQRHVKLNHRVFVIAAIGKSECGQLLCAVMQRPKC